MVYKQKRGDQLPRSVLKEWLHIFLYPFPFSATGRFIYLILKVVWSYILKLTEQQDKEPQDIDAQGATQICPEQPISVLNLTEREMNIYHV